MNVQQQNFFGTPKTERKLLIPVVKLGEPLTYCPWQFAEIDGIVVRMHDLLTPTGKKFKSIIEKIEATGGIRTHLGYAGPILLSSIMSDQKIFNSTPEMYAHAIQTLKPDFFMTLDGETYLEKILIGEFEVERILQQTAWLISKCKRSIPVGLVKGSNPQQINLLLSTYKDWGLNDYVFHSGDFICKGNRNSVQEAKRIVRNIRPKIPRLFMYGIGARKNFQRFRTADGYITQSHYVNEFYGIKIVDNKIQRQKKTPSKKSIMENLNQIRQTITNTNQRTGGLKQWVEDTAPAEQAMPNNDTKKKFQIRQL
ncbi:MAG: hypothetical protein HY392_03665 [Candidatus Diapherotrites archaeon]|nr:hypothetical protein [Candidatus Diapherotrites archaeon]